jgi:hypothetical protein
MSNNGEDFDLLRKSYGKLVKSGEAGLRAAYSFGQVSSALNDMGYTQVMLGDIIGRTGACVGSYIKLFKRWPHVNALINTARILGTYDVSRLNGSAGSVSARYVLHCDNCGGTDFHRVREDAEAAGPVLEGTVVKAISAAE